MHGHVLLNLLNVCQLGQSDKMLSKPHILSLFTKSCNRFNNTGAQMLDSIYHMMLKLVCNCNCGVKKLTFCPIYTQCCYECHFIYMYAVTKIGKPLVVYRF